MLLISICVNLLCVGLVFDVFVAVCGQTEVQWKCADPKCIERIAEGTAKSAYPNGIKVNTALYVLRKPSSPQGKDYWVQLASNQKEMLFPKRLFHETKQLVKDALLVDQHTLPADKTQNGIIDPSPSSVYDGTTIYGDQANGPQHSTPQPTRRVDPPGDGMTVAQTTSPASTPSSTLSQNESEPRVNVKVASGDSNLTEVAKSPENGSLPGVPVKEAGNSQLREEKNVGNSDKIVSDKEDKTLSKGTSPQKYEMFGVPPSCDLEKKCAIMNSSTKPGTSHEHYDEEQEDDDPDTNTISSELTVASNEISDDDDSHEDSADSGLQMVNSSSPTSSLDEDVSGQEIVSQTKPEYSHGLGKTPEPIIQTSSATTPSPTLTSLTPNEPSGVASLLSHTAVPTSFVNSSTKPETISSKSAEVLSPNINETEFSKKLQNDTASSNHISIAEKNSFEHNSDSSTQNTNAKTASSESNSQPGVSVSRSYGPELKENQKSNDMNTASFSQNQDHQSSSPYWNSKAKPFDSSADSETNSTNALSDQPAIPASLSGDSRTPSSPSGDLKTPASSSSDAYVAQTPSYSSVASDSGIPTSPSLKPLANPASDVKTATSPSDLQTPLPPSSDAYVAQTPSYSSVASDSGIPTSPSLKPLANPTSDVKTATTSDLQTPLPPTSDAYVAQTPSYSSVASDSGIPTSPSLKPLANPTSDMKTATSPSDLQTPLPPSDAYVAQTPSYSSVASDSGIPTSPSLEYHSGDAQDGSDGPMNDSETSTSSSSHGTTATKDSSVPISDEPLVKELLDGQSSESNVGSQSGEVDSTESIEPEQLEDSSTPWYASFMDIFQGASSSEKETLIHESGEEEPQTCYADSCFQQGHIDEPITEDQISEWLSPRSIIVIITTTVAVIAFSLGYYYLENQRRDTELISKYNDLSEKLFIERTEREMIAKQLTEANDSLNHISVDSTKNNEEIERLRAEVKTYKEENALITEKEKETSKKFMMVDKNYNELRKILSQTKQKGERSALIADIKTLKDSIEANNIEIASLKEQLLEKKDEIKSLNNQIMESKSCKSQLEKSLEDTISGAHIQAQKFQESIAKLEKIIEENTTAHAKLEEECTQLKKEKESLTLEKELVESSLQKFQRLQPAHSLKEWLNAKEVRVSLLAAEKKLQELSDQNDSLLSDKTQLEGKLGMVTGDLEQLNEKYETAEKDKIEALTKLQVLSDYFKEKETQLQEELGSKEALWLQKQSDDRTIYEQMRALREENASFKNQNETLKREILDQEASFKKLITSAEEKAHENWVALRHHERRLKEAHMEASQLRSRLTSLEATGDNTDDKIAKSGPLEVNGDMPSFGSATSPPFMLYSEFMPPPPLVSATASRPPPLGRISSPPLVDFTPPPPLVPYEMFLPPSPPPPQHGPPHVVHKPQPLDGSHRVQKDSQSSNQSSESAPDKSRRNKR